MTLASWKVGDIGWAAPYGWDVDQVPSAQDAIALATRAHRGERYASPDREPCIFHPLRVMLSLVAVLHDVVEDTNVELPRPRYCGLPA